MSKVTKLILWIVVASVFSCSQNPKSVPERNFYFEVQTHQHDAFSAALEAYLTAKIPGQKYTITHMSARTWPYFVALGPNETIVMDSLVPPHWFLHKMIVWDSTLTMGQDDHLVRIHVMPRTDTVVNFQVEIFDMDSSGLKLTANSGVHYVDTLALRDHAARLDHFFKAIILYSFK